QRAWTSARADGTPRLWVRAALAAALAGEATSVARYYPQTLSHFSVLVGGVRGAARLGIEPTYWWDALDGEVLEWINSHTAANAAAAFSWIPDYNVALLQGWGRLRTRQSDPTWGIPFKWYVLQNRTSVLTDVDRKLMESYTPAYTKYPGHHAGRVP